MAREGWMKVGQSAIWPCQREEEKTPIGEEEKTPIGAGSPLH